MKKNIRVMLLAVSFLGLAACGGGSGGGSDAKADDTTTTVTPPVETPPPVDFPDEALVNPPEPSKERRDTGNMGDSKIYYVSIAADGDEIDCMKQSVEIRASFFENNSESWAPGQASEWDSKRTEVYVQIRNDSLECDGSLLIFENTVYLNDITSFTIDGQSIEFYAEIPVDNWDTGDTYLVTIAIDGSEAAKGKLEGTNVTTSKNEEKKYQYDASSTFRRGVLNIVIFGGIYLDNQPLTGTTKAKVTREITNYKSNGVRPTEDSPCCEDKGRG